MSTDPPANAIRLFVSAHAEVSGSLKDTIERALSQWLASAHGTLFLPVVLAALAQIVLLVLVVLLVLRQLRTAEQLRRLNDAAAALGRGDRNARAGLTEGPLSRFGQAFDDMATLMTREIRSLRDSQRELEQLVATDRLTGVGNRRHFEQQAEAECARARRYGIPVTLILFDVDDFKHINDAFGHQVGDAALITLTRRVASRLRDTDAIARWGGEEFAILAPCTTSAGAEVLADKIRAVVADEDFDVVGRVTISLGIAQLLPDESTPRWIGRADDRLYEAKRAGRNRVVSSVQPETHLAASMLVWGEQFLVHHPLVDAQHAEIFRLSNELILDPAARSLDLTLRQFDVLFDAVAKHFIAEEQVLLDHGCPGRALSTHAEMHHGLLAQVAELRRRLAQRTATVSEVGDFMIRRIAVGHMLDADLPLFASLTTSVTVPVHEEGARPSLRLRLKSAIAKR